MKAAVIFGGTGFIGVSFATHLLHYALVDIIYLVDIEPIEIKKSQFRKNQVQAQPKIRFIHHDVRHPIRWVPAEEILFIANFAAVHREPGHDDAEYFETNILGAENVCSWAEKVGCERMVFTSSISPYGIGDHVKDELSLPNPTSSYGGSKLVAEKIHQIWQARNEMSRELLIVRPGVVFGPGEGGNVSRLIKAVMRHYFFYVGNYSTRKAGVYVKELCEAICWMLQRKDLNNEKVRLFNMTMNPGPSIGEYVEAVCTAADVKRFIFTLPYGLLLVVAKTIDVLTIPLGIKHPFSPVRIKKLVRSNNVLPNYLVEKNYPFRYTLQSAFEDWLISCPEEWK